MLVIPQLELILKARYDEPAIEVQKVIADKSLAKVMGVLYLKNSRLPES
jgi:hypothetical protein